MDTYLYGLLGVSLAANAFSAINTLVANSKKRDDDNQRTISSIYDEMNRKIDDLSNDTNHRFCGLEDLTNSRLTSEISDLRQEFNDNIDSFSTMIEDLTDKVYESQVYDLDNYTGTKGKTKVSRKSKKRN
jgi:methyl-accepting chemotaxis protein